LAKIPTRLTVESLTEGVSADAEAKIKAREAEYNAKRQEKPAKPKSSWFDSIKSAFAPKAKPTPVGPEPTMGRNLKAKPVDPKHEEASLVSTVAKMKEAVQIFKANGVDSMVQKLEPFISDMENDVQVSRLKEAKEPPKPKAPKKKEPAAEKPAEPKPEAKPKKTVAKKAKPEAAPTAESNPTVDELVAKFNDLANANKEIGNEIRDTGAANTPEVIGAAKELESQTSGVVDTIASGGSSVDVDIDKAIKANSLRLSDLPVGDKKRDLWLKRIAGAFGFGISPEERQNPSLQTLISKQFINPKGPDDRKLIWRGLEKAGLAQPAQKPSPKPVSAPPEPPKAVEPSPMAEPAKAAVEPLAGSPEAGTAPDPDAVAKAIAVFNKHGANIPAQTAAPQTAAPSSAPVSTPTAKPAQTAAEPEQDDASEYMDRNPEQRAKLAKVMNSLKVDFSNLSKPAQMFVRELETYMRKMKASGRDISSVPTNPAGSPKSYVNSPQGGATRFEESINRGGNSQMGMLKVDKNEMKRFIAETLENIFLEEELAESYIDEMCQKTDESQELEEGNPFVPPTPKPKPKSAFDRTSGPARNVFKQPPLAPPQQPVAIGQVPTNRPTPTGQRDPNVTDFEESIDRTIDEVIQESEVALVIEGILGAQKKT